MSDDIIDITGPLLAENAEKINVDIAALLFRDKVYKRN